MSKSRNSGEDSFSLEEQEIPLKGQSCEECTRNCLITHGNRMNPYSSLNIFFKVMIGDDFLDVLFLPPRFARTVSGFVNEEAYLEDSLGQKYKVTFSKIDGSLAFQEGWNKFAIEHGLEEGDFLVFHYFRHNTKFHSFIVHILGKSGCDKLNFPQENGPGKRKRSMIVTNGENTLNEACKRQEMNLTEPSVVSKSRSMKLPEASIVSKPCKGQEIKLPEPSDVPKSCSNGDNNDDSLNINDGNNNENSLNTNDGEKLQLVPCLMEDPLLYMLNRDDGHNQDDRTCLYDLSSYEKPVKAITIINTPTFENESDLTVRDNGHNQDDRISLYDLSTFEKPGKSISIINESALPLNSYKNTEDSEPVNGTLDTGGIDLTVQAAEESYKLIPCLNGGSIDRNEDNNVLSLSDPIVSTPVYKDSYGAVMKKVKIELGDSEKSRDYTQLLSENMPTMRRDITQKSFDFNNITQKSFGADNITQKSFGVNNITQKSFGADNITQKSFGVNNITQKSFGDITQKSFGVNDITQKSFGVNDITQKSFGVNNITQKSIGVNDITQKSIGVNDITQKSFGVNDITQKPFGVNIDKTPHELKRNVKTEFVDLNMPIIAVSPCAMVIDNLPIQTPTTAANSYPRWAQINPPHAISSMPAHSYSRSTAQIKQEAISSMPANSHSRSTAQMNPPNTQQPWRSNNVSFEKSSSIKKEEVFVRKTSNQVVGPSSESRAVVTYTPPAPSGTSSSTPLFIDSDSGSDSELPKKKGATLSEIIESLRQKRKRCSRDL